MMNNDKLKKILDKHLVNGGNALYIAGEDIDDVVKDLEAFILKLQSETRERTLTEAIKEIEIIQGDEGGDVIYGYEEACKFIKEMLEGLKKV